MHQVLPTYIMYKRINFQPQHSLPDVFLWLISGGKRQAYLRTQARNIVYSIVDEECGKDCGKVQTMFLKVNLLKKFIDTS